MPTMPLLGARHSGRRCSDGELSMLGLRLQPPPKPKLPREAMEEPTEWGVVSSSSIGATVLLELLLESSLKAGRSHGESSSSLVCSSSQPAFELISASHSGNNFMRDQARIPTNCNAKPTACWKVKLLPMMTEPTMTIITSFKMMPVKMNVMAELFLMNNAWEMFIAKARQPFATRRLLYSTMSCHDGSISATGREGQQTPSTAADTLSTRKTKGARSMT
mmetsp:Transcript_128703/g.412287  ORF Transcript_128703/g.412287 Transcript_128703/m.412287 type:complete len:220 (-) Transcript_128703:716-1375(-)